MLQHMSIVVCICLSLLTPSLAFQISNKNPRVVALQWNPKPNVQYSLSYREVPGVGEADKQWNTLNIPAVSHDTGYLEFARESPCLSYDFSLGSWNSTSLVDSIQATAPAVSAIVERPLTIRIALIEYLTNQNVIQTIVTWDGGLADLDSVWPLEELHIQSNVQVSETCGQISTPTKIRLLSPTTAELLFPHEIADAVFQGAQCQAEFTILNMVSQCGQTVDFSRGTPKVTIPLFCDHIRSLPCPLPVDHLLTQRTPPNCHPKTIQSELLPRIDQMVLSWVFDDVTPPYRYIMKHFDIDQMGSELKTGQRNKRDLPILKDDPGLFSNSIEKTEELEEPSVSFPLGMFNQLSDHAIAVCAIYDLVTQADDIDWNSVPKRKLHLPLHIDYSLDHNELVEEPQVLDHAFQDSFGGSRTIVHPARAPIADWRNIYNTMILLVAAILVIMCLILFLVYKSGRPSNWYPYLKRSRCFNNPIFVNYPEKKVDEKASSTCSTVEQAVEEMGKKWVTEKYIY